MGRRAIDLCAGAGGLSLGLARAGFDVLGVEQDPDAVATHLAHVGPCELADVTTWHPPRPVDLVVAGVPCQPFSDAGKRAAFDDPRGMLFAHLLRVAREAGARAVVPENVRGFKRLALPIVARAFEHAGFAHWRATMLSARDYDVPQHRQRLFIVGFREADAFAAFRWPAPSRGAPGNLLGLPPWVTVREALGLGGALDAPSRTVRTTPRGVGATRMVLGAAALDPLDCPAPTVVANATHQGAAARRSQRKWSALADALDAPAPTVLTREHRSSVAHGSRGGVASKRYAGDRLNPALALALDPVLAASGLLDRPATTVNTTNGIEPARNHARQKRAVRLTIEHLAALQGAPEFVFVGDVESQHKQCGNMVPPALAAAVAGAVRAALDAADAAAEGRGAA